MKGHGASITFHQKTPGLPRFMLLALKGPLMQI